MTAVDLLPIFRSENQLKLLGFIMTHAGEASPIAEISRRTGVSQQTASREIERLRRAGLVRVRAAGRNRLVEADDGSPYFAELRGLLLKVVGPAAALSEALGRIAGVEQAFIFGSWARRYRGEPGPPPNDIDVIVIGDPDVDGVDAACATVGRRLGLEINAVFASVDEWTSSTSAFLRQVRAGALVQMQP